MKNEWADPGDASLFSTMLLGGAAAEIQPSALILFVFFFFPADGATGTFHQPDHQQRKV